jgi:small-conductance mechanosensitive channel
MRCAVILLSPLLPESEKLVDMGLRVVITILGAFLVQRMLFVLAGRLERVLTHAGHGTPQAEQRTRTLGQIFKNLATVVVFAAAVLHILSLWGWDVRPLVAGAGIIGVALGFGAQTLVRDVIAGVFILTENQFGVGDVIEVSGKAGTVEAVSVRCTTLRDFHGFVHFVPNGEMKIVVNRSRGWNRIAVDIGVSAIHDLDAALEICRRTVDEMNRDPDWRERLLDPVEVWGVESISGPDVQIRMVVRTRPGADGPEAGRELRRRVLHALAREGIRATASREIGLEVAAGSVGPVAASGRE